MRLLISFLLFMFLVDADAQTIYNEIVKSSIKQTKSYKVNDSTSLHFMVSEKRKPFRYEYQPYLVGENVKKLVPFSFEKEPKIIASHIVNDKWIYIFKTKRDRFVIEYDIKKEKASSIKILDTLKYDHLIQKEDASIFIKLDNVIKVTHITDVDNIVTHVYAPDNHNDPVLLNKFNSNKQVISFNSSSFIGGIDYVTTKEYVDIGSIKLCHSYIYDKDIIITYDDKSEETSFVIKLNYTKSGSYQVKSFKNKLKNNRQVRSFATKNTLFQFAVDFKQANLSVFDLETTELITTFTYTKESFGPYNKYFYKKKVVEVKPEKFFASFAKFNPFSTYIPTIFITVNKGENDSYIVESGHINGATYTYNNHFDHMFLHNQMMHHQPPINVPRFGPNPNHIPFKIVNEEDDLKKTSFILAIDSTFKKINFIPKSIYTKDKWKEANKKIEKSKENTNLRYFSKVKLINSMRYMYYYKRSKNILIREINNN